MPKPKKEGSLLGLFRGFEYLEKVLCPHCKKKAEKALNQWMVDEFNEEKARYDRKGKKPRMRLLKKEDR